MRPTISSRLRHCPTCPRMSARRSMWRWPTIPTCWPRNLCGRGRFRHRGRRCRTAAARVAVRGCDLHRLFQPRAGGAAGITQEETTANAGVNLSIPIFQGGLSAARQRQAQARETAALEQVIAAERETIAQVRAAWSSWQASLAVIESSRCSSRSRRTSTAASRGSAPNARSAAARSSMCSMQSRNC